MVEVLHVNKILHACSSIMYDLQQYVRIMSFYQESSVLSDQPLNADLSINRKDLLSVTLVGGNHCITSSLQPAAQCCTDMLKFLS